MNYVLIRMTFAVGSRPTGYRSFIQSTRRDRVEFFRGRRGDCHAIGAKPLKRKRNTSSVVLDSSLYLYILIRPISCTCDAYQRNVFYLGGNRKERSVCVNGALFESGMKILEKKIPPSPFLAAKLRGRYCGACARQRFKQVKKRSGRKRREKRRKKKKEKGKKKGNQCMKTESARSL